MLGRCGGIGRHASLKMMWEQSRVGSTPTSGTICSDDCSDDARLPPAPKVSAGRQNCVPQGMSVRLPPCPSLKKAKILLLCPQKNNRSPDNKIKTKQI